MRGLADQLVREPIHWMTQISSSIPFYVDYRGRRHVYINCPSLTLELNAGEFGNLHFSGNVWYELPFSQGTKLYATNRANAAQIQVLATDEVIAHRPDEAIEFLGLTANTLNANLLTGTDVQFFDITSLQLYGTFVATVTFQGGNDQINWFPVNALPNASSTPTTTASAPGLYFIPCPFRFVRVPVTAYTSGTLQGIVECYRERFVLF